MYFHPSVLTLVSLLGSKKETLSFSYWLNLLKIYLTSPIRHSLVWNVQVTISYHYKAFFPRVQKVAS